MANLPWITVDVTRTSPLAASDLTMASLRRSVTVGRLVMLSAAPEREDPEGRWCHELQPRVGLDPRLGGKRLIDGAVDRRPEGIQSKGLDRQPDLDRAAGSRQLQPSIGEVDACPAPLGEVLGVQLERPLEQSSLAHEQTADLEWHR